MKLSNATLSVAAGLLGGFLSHYALTPTPVLAQNGQAQQPVPTEVRAQRFVLMNEKGQVGGVIGFDTQGAPTMRLYRNGQEIYYAGEPGSVERPLAQSSPATEIRAQRFLLMNEKGEPSGVIASDKDGIGTIRLYHGGREIFNAGGSPTHLLGE